MDSSILRAPEKVAQDLMQHALQTHYTGPCLEGPMYGSWPLSELLKDKSLDVQLAFMREYYKLTGGGKTVNSGAEQQRKPRYTDEEKLRMRMGWDQTQRSDRFATINIHSLKDKVLVFVVMHDDSHVVIEDDKGLFPSDALVTALRVLE